MNPFFPTTPIVIPSLGLLLSVATAFNQEGYLVLQCTFKGSNDNEFVKVFEPSELIPLLHAAGIEGTVLAYQLGQLVINNDVLIGTKEFANILGWQQARLSTLFSRQSAGSKVEHPLPEPIEHLASTPVWRMSQAIQYKEKRRKE